MKFVKKCSACVFRLTTPTTHVRVGYVHNVDRNLFGIIYTVFQWPETDAQTLVSRFSTTIPMSTRDIP